MKFIRSKKAENVPYFHIMIILGMFVSMAGTAFAESSEPFPDEEWNRTYNLGEVDNTQWIGQTSDGGYIIIGSMNYFLQGNSLSRENIIVKTDANGELQWSRKFTEKDEGRAGYMKQTCVMQTSDSGYLIAGSTENSTTGSLNIWIRKMDGEGIEQWKKDFMEERPFRQFFGGNNITALYNEADRSVRETPDGGFLILGKTNHCQNCSNEKEGILDIWLIKIDPEGNEEWNRTLGRTDKTAFSFTVTNDNGFILAGVSDTGTSWFIKSDQSGNELWNRTYEGIGGLSVIIRQASDGGYAAAIANHSGSQISLIRTDADGRKQWEKIYGDSSFHDFQLTKDGGFLLWQSEWPKSRLLKLDQGGNEQWRRNLNDFVVSYVEQTQGGDYLLSATKLSDDVILGYTVEKLNSRGNKLWEKSFGNELSWSLSVKAKTTAETGDGFIVMGSASPSRYLKLKKFKNREVPFAVFTYEPEYPGVNQTITFDASVSNDPGGNITNYRWDFGDGNTTVTSAKKITHSYAKAGEATVGLTVMNKNNGLNSTWKKVFVQKLTPPEETLNVTFGDFTGAKYVAETSDRGFIIAGMNNSIYETWLVKTDPDGREQWNWTYTGMELKSFIQTQDDGFLATGEIDMSDIRLIKIDQYGKEQWNRIFMGKGIAPYLSFGIVFGENGTVAQTHDGGYVIAGLNKKAHGELWDAWLVKTDPYGNESWSRILKGNRNGQNTLSSVQETSDGGYIVTGTWWNPYGGPDPDAILIRTDPEGNEKWTWTSNGSGLNEAGSGFQTSDGGFVMMGTSSYLNQSGWDFQTGPEWDTDIWVMKTDASGTEKWRRNNRVKSLAWETSLSVTQDGGYVYSVIVQESPENDYEYDNSFNMKYVKLDPNGNIEWQKRDEGLSIRPTSDGGYVTVRGSRLVKFGGVKTEPMQNGILVTANQTIEVGAYENRNVTHIENARGFELVMAMAVLLALFAAGRKRI